MQPVTRWQRLRSRAGSLTTSDFTVGAISIGLAVVVMMAFTVAYLRPPGQKTITFETTDASAITTGQDVRVAGISVGTVSDVSIGSDSVTVHARIDRSTFVGDQSRVEVRMLTPVGGYAVTLIPMGANPTPDGMIAPERVTVPYSIGDVLQVAPDVTDEVNADTIHANLEQVSDALRENPSSVREIVDGMNSVTGILDRQRTQIHEIAALAAEYLQTFNMNREFVFELIRKIDIVLSTYNNTKVGFNETYRILSSVLGRLRPLETVYLDNVDTLRQQLGDLQGTVADIGSSLGPAIDNLTSLRGQLADWLTPTGMKEMGGGTMALSNVCVPIAGRTC